MASALLEKVLRQVKALTPDEQRQVRELLDTLLKPPRPEGSMNKENELAQALLKAGVISEIKPPITDLTPYRNRKPIENDPI